MTEQPGEGAGPGDREDDADRDEQAPEGADLARTALGRARAAAARKGLRPGQAPPGRRFGDDRRPEGPRRGDPSARSGAWPDARDPQSLDATLGRFVGERGWQEPVAVGGAFGRWDAVVGAELAGHCTPESLKDGTLVVRAESTAWATQVRLLTSHLVRRLDEELGHGVVTKVVVRGPQSPSWRKGGRSAPGGRGPRDTYG
ncbi:DUF721 domain-containing protein [Kineococcus rhizosphaerae]|uniref:Putative nucleic acid-binding Zn ribbon protein n=1 Tax=Kineococcus rhizosphaerae TaxID=559628 RepID=A0A2T0QYI2_9ACTN|nr:DciA family protein [Kineococcus rhizosphaerae]PRY11429.1 putative nucleic acid-binding Zn ribbon protein [Kineococcus rhizosphaerae]